MRGAKKGTRGSKRLLYTVPFGRKESRTVLWTSWNFWTSDTHNKARLTQPPQDFLSPRPRPYSVTRIRLLPDRRATLFRRFIPPNALRTNRPRLSRDHVKPFAFSVEKLSSFSRHAWFILSFILLLPFRVGIPFSYRAVQPVVDRRKRLDLFSLDLRLRVVIRRGFPTL